MTVAEIAPAIRPLILLLSSDKPGEVAAAAAQISRRLRKAGLDWHDLADAIGEQPVRSRAPVARTWVDVVDHVLAPEGASLDPRERAFAESMRSILARGWPPSEKQQRWMRALFERAGGTWAAEEAA